MGPSEHGALCAHTGCRPVKLALVLMLQAGQRKASSWNVGSPLLYRVKGLSAQDGQKEAYVNPGPVYGIHSPESEAWDTPECKADDDNLLPVT